MNQENRLVVRYIHERVLSDWERRRPALVERFGEEAVSEVLAPMVNEIVGLVAGLMGDALTGKLLMEDIP